MEIALLNVKVTFQKNFVAADDIGNRKNVWEDYYTCHAIIPAMPWSAGKAGRKRQQPD